MALKAYPHGQSTSVTQYMDIVEAKTIISRHVAEYRKKPYRELCLLMSEGPHTFVETAQSGAEYQIQINVYWENRRRGALRLFGSIDDGNYRPWKLLPWVYSAITDDDIIERPDDNAKEH